MKLSVLNWLDWEFVEVRCEAQSGKTAAEQGDAVFDQARAALKSQGLTLSNTVRSRVFGVDRPARDAVSNSRFAALKGNDRAASSSYIAPKHFSSKALVALDLIAVRPRPDVAKVIKEDNPPKPPICYITLGPLLVLSGNTSELPTLKEQVTQDILPRVDTYLKEGGSSWKQVVNVSCYMHESQKPEELRAHFKTIANPFPVRFEIFFVEGFSSPGKLVEVEVTAQRNG